jgi:cytochrome c-type biogenesis protein CcmH
MMGWVILAGIAVGAALLLWVTGFPRKLWTVAATALTLGAAGYAWQGSPGLAGHPVTAVQKAGEIDPDIVALRDATFGRITCTWAWRYRRHAPTRMTRAPASPSTGRGRLARSLTVRQAPGRCARYGHGFGDGKLAEHDGNQISPAAQFAFDRAALKLAPAASGPAVLPRPRADPRGQPLRRGASRAGPRRSR